LSMVGVGSDSFGVGGYEMSSSSCTVMMSLQVGQQPPSPRRRANRLQSGQRRSPASRSDADERARVVALFAAAPDELIRALCSAELAGLLGTVIKRRNDWSAHGGATTDHVQTERNGWLVEQIEALRGIIDGAWLDAPLVRAGRAEVGDNVYTYDVERVMGLNTPFLTDTITVGSRMKTGELYLVTDNAQRAQDRAVRPAQAEPGQRPVRLLLLQPRRRRRSPTRVVPPRRRRRGAGAVAEPRCAARRVPGRRRRLVELNLQGW